MLVELAALHDLGQGGEMLLSVSSRHRRRLTTDRQTSRSVMVTILPVVL